MKRKKSEIYKEKALHYIDRVMSGKRIAGRYEKLAVKRHLDDLRKVCILMKRRLRKHWYFLPC